MEAAPQFDTPYRFRLGLAVGDVVDRAAGAAHQEGAEREHREQVPASVVTGKGVHLVTVNETAGIDWMTPTWFRFGASSLLNDVLMQIRKERTGRYSGGDYFTLD